jgi:2-keto-3-deoxy-L-rhamnonate aldolase RhmA
MAPVFRRDCELRNDLKRRLKSGEQAYGIWITIESPLITEYISTLGFDYLVFDTEHSPLDIYQTQILMQAMRDKGTIPIVRVWWNDPVAVKRALDIGAYGIIIPWINNKDQAEMAVKACKYPPEGLRGYGPRRSTFDDPDYLKTANDEILVITQIETKEAVDNIESIVTVEGIDVTYIGPFDLSASLGHLGDMTHPDVQSAIERVHDTSKKAGIASGIHMGAGKTVQDREREGYNFITVSSDFELLQSGALQALKQIGKT